jgi:uncharacterized protein (TIGR00106 family)
MIAEFAVFPLGGSHMSTDVAEAINELEATGLTFSVGPMGTTVEGNCEQVFSAMQRCYERVAKEHERVIMTVTVDGRKSQAHSMAEMVPAVARKLKHPSSERHLEIAGKYKHVSQS